ncbi:hypothetical protein HS7_06290 [Sulfolobales archaeon HS-7]|nr:hypothetical protein HS7_06290 [Sulfolobales archaeon HS-7]
MRVIVLGNIPELLIDKVLDTGATLFHKGNYVPFIRRNQFDKIAILFEKRFIRGAYNLAKKISEVYALSYPELGDSIELVGALRENGVKAGILWYGKASIEERSIPLVFSKKVRVAVIRPDEPDLLGWVIEDSDNFVIDYLENYEEGNYDLVGCLDCTACFPTFDSRLVALAAILNIKCTAVTVSDVRENDIILNIPCERKFNERVVSLVRPNKWFSRFQIVEGKIEGRTLHLSNGAGAILERPLGKAFLLYEMDASSLMEEIYK